MTWDQKHLTCINNSDHLKNHHNSQTQVSWFCTHACSYTCAHIYTTHMQQAHTPTPQPEVSNFQFAWTIVSWSCIHTPAHIHACTHTELDDPKNEYSNIYVIFTESCLSWLAWFLAKWVAGNIHLCANWKPVMISFQIFMYFCREDPKNPKETSVPVTNISQTLTGSF